MITRRATGLPLFLLCVFAAQPALCAFAAQSEHNAIEVQDAWVRLGSGDRPTAAYFEILNSGNEDRLVGITSPASEKVVLSRLRWRGLNTRMEPVPFVKIPEVHRVTFKPGDYTAVFVGLTEPLSIGQIVSLDLQFEHAGTVTIEAKVANRLLGGGKPQN